ncbi:MAG: tryptophan synthase subunit alpha [Planctomycetes bacterium]|nr:tryptophan synthase subunit alpha [Planctomycetota bacterium]
MNRLRRRFQQLQASGQKALLPYVTGGYPDAATTIEILRGIDPTRCACVELGLPFSDPIADGPVIQTSFSRALEGGFRIDGLFDELAGQRDEIAVPLIAMVSYSIVYRREPRAFVARAANAGIDGLIVPDIPLEEVDELAAIGRDRDCPIVMLVAPTSRDPRRARIAALSEPFIYYQSTAGVTGEREQLPTDLLENVARLRAQSGKPVCVGFGISKPEHVAAVCRVADGAIVGSAIVRRMNAAVDRGASASATARDVIEFIETLAAAVPAADEAG